MDDPGEDFLKKDLFKIFPLGSSKAWAYHSALKPWLEKNGSEYDVIIIHGLWLYHSYATIKVLKEMRKKGNAPRVYVMPHGMLDPWFQKDSSRKWKAIRNEIYWRLIEKDVVNSADGLLFTCQQELELARTTFRGYSPKQELNVSYGVQPPPVRLASMSPVLSGRYWLFLSRIHPKKGVDLLISAYQALLGQGNDLPDLVIAGPLNSDYAFQMQEMASSCNKIHFTGMLTGDAKWGALYGCEVFILPSHQENFGIAIVEAMACGKPVAITRCVNIWTVVEQYHAGYIFNDRLQDTIEVLERILKDAPESIEQFGKNAENAYTENYRPQNAAAQLLEAIN